MESSRLNSALKVWRHLCPIRVARTRLGMSDELLAEKLECSRRTIVDAEAGSAPFPLDLLNAFAYRFEISPIAISRVLVAWAQSKPTEETATQFLERNL